MTERRRRTTTNENIGFQKNPCHVVYTMGELGTVKRDMTQCQLSELLKNPEVMLVSVNDSGTKKYYPRKRK